MSAGSTTPAPRSRTTTPWWVAPLLVLGPGAYLVILVGGAIAALLSGSTQPGLVGVGQALVVIKRLIGGVAPAKAWAPNELNASAATVWVSLAIAAVLYAALVIAIFLAIENRRADRVAASRGFASDRELRRRRLTEGQAVEQAKRTTKRLSDVSSRRVDPYREAVFLGHSVAGRTRKPVFIQHRDGVLIHGPTGAGKTWRLAVPLILGAPGFVLVTSTKNDVLAATVEDRLAKGRVVVFDPENITGWPAEHKLRWSLLAGCQDPEVAIRRAKALVQAMPMNDTTNASYWDGKAATLMRCYLHAAALTNRSLTDVRLWTSKRKNESVLETLRANGRADWAAELDQILSSHSDSTDDMIGSASRLLEPLSSPALSAAMEATAEESCDLYELLFNGTNTLYLHSTHGEEASAAPFTAVLAAEVYYLAHRESQRRHQDGGRLDPPVRLILDEVNNVAPIPALPDRITDSGGRGISIYAFSHGRLQNIHRWGDHLGRMFTTNSPVRIFLPGMGDGDELEDVSRLLGDVKEWVSNADGHASLHTNRVMSGAEIREMDEDKSLLVYRGAKPILLHLPTVWDFPESKALIESSMALFSQIIETGEIPKVPAAVGGGFVSWSGRS